MADRAVIVTGAASGIGRSIAEVLARHGARVYLVDRDRAGLDAAMSTIEDPLRHRAETLDLASVAGHPALVERVERTLGPLHALVHAAAVLRRHADITAVTEEDWDVQLDVNLKASFFLARAAAEAMRAGGRGGRIVCFSSQGWWTGGFGGSVVYSASKGGIVSMARGLARTYGPDGICVNVIAPGLVDTPMLRADISADTLAELTASTPLRRMADPREIAAVAAFLVSDHASYVSGATLNVSGGFLLY